MKTIKLLIAILAFQVVHAQNPEQARQLIASERYDEALKVLSTLRSNTETLNQVNYYTGNVYYKQGKNDSAILYYKMIPEGDKDYISLLARGRTALLQKDLATAKLNFDKAAQVTKNRNAEVLYEIGDAYVSPSGTVSPEVITKLEAAVALSAQEASYYIRLGDAYAASKDAGKALSQYENAVTYDPKNAVGWLHIARINSDAHLFDVSAGNYEKYLALQPNDAVAWKEYGENLYYAGRYNEVPAAFQKYIDLNNNDKETKLDLCVLYYTFGEYQKAIDCAQEIANADSMNYVAWRIISFSDYQLKKYPEGYAASMKFWSIDDKKVKPQDYIYSARLASLNKDTTRTMFFFDEALKSDSVNADMYTEYGKTLFSLRKWEEAAKNFELKDSLYGNGSLDIFYLGRAYFNMKDYVKADTAFAKFVEKQPTSPDGYLWRAKSNSSLDTLEFKGLAFPYYQKYIEIASADPEKNKVNLVDAYIYMAVYYNSKRDNKSAKEFLNKALALDPENKFANELKETL